MATDHAFEFLEQSSNHFPDVIAVVGNDASLRSWVMEKLTVDGDVMQVSGESSQWSDLKDELTTASLFDFGEGKKTVVIRDADSFVSAKRSPDESSDESSPKSNNRVELESYVARPAAATRLVLEFESLASNTRLYKAIDKHHLLVQCHAGVDKKRGVTYASRQKFITTFLAGRHRVQVSKDAANALIELLGEELGMLDSEIAKLALYREPNGLIDESLVREVVTGWQGKTVWEINEAIASGNAAEALKHLDKLMSGGQPPIALLPQIAWSLRRLGVASAVIHHSERMGRKIREEDALDRAGFRTHETPRAKSHLRGLRRDRAKQLLAWLLDADLRLKGTHSRPWLDRFMIEHLIVKLSNRSTGSRSG
ncbi:MAG: DNA polymerase III subunit delta [Rubripirellula sp.]|nr:DNA polymerase III subunit delta [Rubripirellula sp.]